MKRRVENALIVGGGIAGLATAAALSRRGVACVIAEQTANWAPVGAGISLSVNAMSVLRGLGCAEEVAALGQRLAAASITDTNGSVLGATNFGDLEADHGPTIAIHRANLHEVLLSANDEVTIRLGTSVSSLESTPEGVEVQFTDESDGIFDVVIGADGLRSKVRKLCFGDLPVSYSGYTCWRLVVRHPAEDTVLCEMWGRGQRFGIVPIGGDRTYCFAVANAPRGEVDPEEGRLERFRRRFASFGAQVPEILGTLVEPEELIHNDLEELIGAPWQSGRIGLIGDAAHAMTPNMGQGAAMALEDSAVLVEMLLGDIPVEQSLIGFTARRKTRVDWVQNQSRRIGSVAQWQNGPACALRNQLLRWTPDRLNSAALRKMARQSV
jgi:2-polyprenyl-6-methoxyphenol hydroxylase-like FAD-dependent oxidoreductase